MNLKWCLTSGLLVALGVAMIAGCGKQQPERVPVVAVEGAVKFEGRPLPGALIVLHPKTGQRIDVPTPRAHVERDGTFRITTYEAGDGAPPGDYVATVTWYKLVGQGSDVQAGPNVLPPKYSNAKSSKWEIRVAKVATRLPLMNLRR
jgi:hypothetical protein